MKNVLYITHRVPWPPNRGDRIRTYNIIRFLGERCRLHVASLACEAVPAETYSELGRYCESVRIVPLGKRTRWLRAATSFLSGGTVTEGLFRCSPMQHAIEEIAGAHKFDAVLASSSGVAQYGRGAQLGDARHWVDLIDVDSRKWADYSQASNVLLSRLYRTEASRLQAVETRLAQECDRLTVVTEAEVAVFRKFCSAGDVRAVTNGVDTDYFARPADARDDLRCVFVGVLNYKPNVDGVVWFCRNVWPQIRAVHPTVVFEIVGRDPHRDVLALDSVDGVKVIGAVPDVRPHLWSAAVVVTPLLIARGVQNKVLEAFAASRPVVSSSAPLIGLDLEPGVHAICADQPEDWVAAVSELLSAAETRSRIGDAAREWVLAHHCWDVCLEPFSELTNSAEAAPVYAAVAGEDRA